MFSVSIRRETAAQIEACLSAGNDEQDACPQCSTHYLCDNIWNQIRNGEALPSHQSCGDRGVQVAARDVAHGVSHGQNRQTESESYPCKTDPQVGKGSSKHGTTASAEH